MTDDSGTVREWLRDAQRVTVLTGAGISTDSGIPDFRGPNGLWTKNPEAARMATLQDYVADPEVRRRAWQSRKTHSAWTAEPNDGHRALVDLDKTGRLHAVVTQNIDELHQRAGLSGEKVIEVHGTVWWAVCLTCGVRSPMADELARVSDEVPDPPCTLCGGILKSATISFGQQLDPDVLHRAELLVQAADVMLAVGSTLQVFPAASLVPLAAAYGARVVIINGGPTGMDDEADVVLRGPIGELLPAVVPPD
jgi:NAD-dependent deacetylase